jgi:hypothetical protein
LENVIFSFGSMLGIGSQQVTSCGTLTWGGVER